MIHIDTQIHYVIWPNYFFLTSSTFNHSCVKFFLYNQILTRKVCIYIFYWFETEIAQFDDHGTHICLSCAVNPMDNDVLAT